MCLRQQTSHLSHNVNVIHGRLHDEAALICGRDLAAKALLHGWKATSGLICAEHHTRPDVHPSAGMSAFSTSVVLDERKEKNL